MDNITQVVTSILKTHAMGRRYKIGLIYRGNHGLAKAIIEQGHQAVIIGDRFRPLYFCKKKLQTTSHSIFDSSLLDDSYVVIETDFESLPIKPNSLNVLILSRGLPSGTSPLETLSKLRKLLMPGGLLIWPHPISDGYLGKTGRLFVPIRKGIMKATKKHFLSKWSMEAGFCEIGQKKAKGRGLFSWVVTTGIVGSVFEF